MFQTTDSVSIETVLSHSSFPEFFFYFGSHIFNYRKNFFILVLNLNSKCYHLLQQHSISGVFVLMTAFLSVIVWVIFLCQLIGAQMLNEKNLTDLER